MLRFRGFSRLVFSSSNANNYLLISSLENLKAPSSPDLVIITSKLSMRRVNQNVRDL